jgi:hypothetical protein
MPRANLPDCSQRLRREAEDELPLIEHELKVLGEVVSLIGSYIADVTRSRTLQIANMTRDRRDLIGNLDVSPTQVTSRLQFSSV